MREGTSAWLGPLVRKDLNGLGQPRRQDIEAYRPPTSRLGVIGIRDRSQAAVPQESFLIKGVTVDEFGALLKEADARATELSGKDAATDKALESVRQLIRAIELKK